MCLLDFSTDLTEIPVEILLIVVAQFLGFTNERVSKTCTSLVHRVSFSDKLSIVIKNLKLV